MSKWVKFVTTDNTAIVSLSMLENGPLGEFIKFNDSTGVAESGFPTRTPENKSPVRVATTVSNPVDRDLDVDFDNGSVVDGVTLATNDRILIKDGIAVSIGSYTYDDLAGTPNADGEAEPNNVVFGTWTFDDALSGVPDRDGEAKPNNSLIQSTDEILIFTDDEGGTDRTALTATLKETNDNIMDRIRTATVTFDVISTARVATTLAVPDMTFFTNTPPNVRVTDGAGSNELPSMVAGDTFYVTDHTTHSGKYKVVTVTLDQQDYIVESITGDTDAASGELANTETDVHWALTVDHVSGTGSWASLNEAAFISAPNRTTSINFFDSNAASADQSAAFADLRIDDLIEVGVDGRYYVDGPPVDNTTYWTVPVRFHPSYVEPWPDTATTYLNQHLHNGIYTVNASGAPTRANDYTAGTNVAAAECVVLEGDWNASRLFSCRAISGSDVVGTDALEIKQPRVDHFNATGFGGFTAANEGVGSTSVNNGSFNCPVNLSVAESEGGLRFSGKPHTQPGNPGWGAKNGLPLHVQGIMHQSGGPGCHIIMNERDAPENVVIFRSNLQSVPDYFSGINDDTLFPDLTLLGATIDEWNPAKVYETTIIPQSPSCGYSGTGDFTVTDLTTGRRWTWDDTTYMDPGWVDHGVQSTTTLAYDHTGIMMPNDGVVLSYTMQVYLQGSVGATLTVKPELTRIRPNEAAAGSTNIDMVDPSLVGALGAEAFKMNSVTVGKQTIAQTIPLGHQLADQTFQKGDKLVVALQVLGGASDPDDVRIEWSIQAIFFDPPMLYEGKLDGPLP